MSGIPENKKARSFRRAHQEGIESSKDQATPYPQSMEASTLI